METLTLKVGGMTCGGCVNSVTNVLRALPGVEKAEVDLDKAAATVTFDAAKLTRANMVDAVESAGYDAE